jgi:hypothetical protein
MDFWEQAADERSQAFGLTFEFGGLPCGKILYRFGTASAKLSLLLYRLQAYSDHAVNVVEGVDSPGSEALTKNMDTLINYLTKCMEQSPS